MQTNLQLFLAAKIFLAVNPFAFFPAACVWSTIARGPVFVTMPVELCERAVPTAHFANTFGRFF